MRPISRLLLGTGAVLALGGAALAADRVHVLNVAMPDGSIAHVRYVGDVAPRVVVVPAASMAMPPMDFFADAGSPFAAMDRIAAEMDARADAMLRQAAALASAAPAAAGALDHAALAKLPAGAVSYSMVSYSSGANGTCSRSVQVTALHPGEAPKVVQQSTGDCQAMTRTPTPAVGHAAPADPRIVAARYAPPPKAKATPVI